MDVKKDAHQTQIKSIELQIIKFPAYIWDISEKVSQQSETGREIKNNTDFER